MREDDFLQSLREQPDDLGRRLVFADWLEEQSDPRGELLRLTHLLTTTLGGPQRVALESRLHSLLAAGVLPIGPFWTNSLGMRFAWITPGTFLMGSPLEEADRRDNELPHVVSLTRGFFLGVHAVTQEQWQSVMGKNPSRFPGADRPVECVSWEDCQRFCKRLSEADGTTGDFPSPYRLPTEAEWEYACRSGTTGAYHLGATISREVATYHANQAVSHAAKGQAAQGTAAVGKHPANAWGVTEMHGNVFEWTADWYAPYSAEPAFDPRGPESGHARVLRGGSWHSLAERCRSACRGWAAPAYRGSDVGLRVCFRTEYHFSI